MTTALGRMIVSLAAALCFTGSSLPPPAAQGPTRAVHPNLSGTWAPVDPDAANTFFAVGISPLSGRSTLTIDQRASRVAITMAVPEEDLDRQLPLLISRRFFATVVYSISDERVGGYGAGGAPAFSTPAWVGDGLVIPEALPGGRNDVTMTYSMKGEQLQLQTVSRLPDGRANTFTQLFKKAK